MALSSGQEIRQEGGCGSALLVGNWASVALYGGHTVGQGAALTVGVVSHEGIVVMLAGPGQNALDTSHITPRYALPPTPRMMPSHSSAPSGHGAGVSGLGGSTGQHFEQ